MICVVVGPPDTTPAALTERQREVFVLVTRYTELCEEPPSVSFLARRMGVHRNTVQQHLSAIHRKGWIPAPRPWLRRHDR